MLWKALLDMGVWPASRVVKVDDTPVGIDEGLNAGCWTVGVAITGNAFGLNEKETAALDRGAFESDARGGLCANCPVPARTSSSTASAIFCRCSTRSRAASPAASGPER